MKPPLLPPNLTKLDLATVLARGPWVQLLRLVGLEKGLHPVDFLKLVREYHLLHQPLLLNSVAVSLPWFECFADSSSWRALPCAAWPSS